MTYSLSVLQKTHDKTNFCCGKEMLDHYIKQQVSQDVKKHVAVCYALTDTDSVVKGYYTLSSSSIPISRVPPAYSKRLPYSVIPVILLGRLAVDSSIAKQGQGERLLMDALQRSYLLSKQMGSLAVVVDPIDEDAEAFYKKYDFISLPDSGKMFLAVGTIAKIFSHL